MPDYQNAQVITRVKAMLAEYKEIKCLEVQRIKSNKSEEELESKKYICLFGFVVNTGSVSF